MSGSARVCVRDTCVHAHTWTGWEPGDQASLICHTLSPACLGQFGGLSCLPPHPTPAGHVIGTRNGVSSAGRFRASASQVRRRWGAAPARPLGPGSSRQTRHPLGVSLGWGEALLRLSRCPGTRRSGRRNAGPGGPAAAQLGLPEAWPQL